MRRLVYICLILFSIQAYGQEFFRDYEWDYYGDHPNYSHSHHKSEMDNTKWLKPFGDPDSPHDRVSPKVNPTGEINLPAGSRLLLEMQGSGQSPLALIRNYIPLKLPCDTRVRMTLRKHNRKSNSYQYKLNYIEMPSGMQIWLLDEYLSIPKKHTLIHYDLKRPIKAFYW